MNLLQSSASPLFRSAGTKGQFAPESDLHPGIAHELSNHSRAGLGPLRLVKMSAWRSLGSAPD